MKRTANACKAKARPKPKRKGGRPSLYSIALTDRICGRLAMGESLVSVCKDPAMPGYDTVRRWLRDDEEFQGRYVRAREDQADYLADEIIGIADGDSDPQDKRVRVDARKWVAGKLRPKVYGDRSSMELTGKDGAPLNPTPDQAARHILGLLSLAQPPQDTDDADAG